MWFFPFSASVNAFTSFILGLFVYFKNKKSLLNRTFTFFAFSVGFWSFGYFFWQIAGDSKTALLWTRILMAGAIFIPISYFHFVIYLLNIYKEKRKLLIIGYILCGIFLITDFTSLFIKDVIPKLSFSYWPEPNIFFHPFLLMFFGYVIYSWFLMFRAYRKFFGIKREQIKYVLIGTVIGFLGGSTNYFLWYNIPILPYANLLVALYVILLAYAIVRYRLMDIRFVLGRGAVYGLSLVTITIFAYFLTAGINRLLPEIPSNVNAILILVISILFFQYVFRFFEKFASKYFYYTFYSYQTVLTDLGRGLTRVLDLDTLSSLIVNTLINTIKLDRTVVLLKESDDGEYNIQKNIGFKEENSIALVKDNFLTDWLEKTQNPLVYEEIALIIRDTTNREEKERLVVLQDNMKRIEAALCLPLFIEEKIIGMIVLGNKVSRDPYSSQDIDLLTNLANQASIAFQNAKLYSEIKGFGQKMEKEVKERTKDLKEAYEELKVLDKAKSEFVSIASHQLRTPLTAVKGYISMMMEKSYGKPPEKMVKPLSNIYASNERLIKLVNDLLNISRIESGRTEMKYEEFSLEEIITSLVEELKSLTLEKNIYLKFEKPEKPLSKILADKDKIRQVILNVIDNAIRYTEKGGVTIEIKILDKKYQIKISDTGEGMTKEEISNLFESFSRGTAGTRFWTEGAGLGLYIAKKFVEMHKGEIWAESKGKNKGSTFIIELPIENKI